MKFRIVNLELIICEPSRIKIRHVHANSKYRKCKNLIELSHILKF